MTAQLRETIERYGPFDLAFVKITAYNENWPDIYLDPEQTVEAAALLKATALVSSYRGTFDLGIHSWHESMEGVVKAAEQELRRIITPSKNELVDPEKQESRAWWRDALVGRGRYETTAPVRVGR